MEFESKRDSTDPPSSVIHAIEVRVMLYLISPSIALGVKHQERRDLDQIACQDTSDEKCQYMHKHSIALEPISMSPDSKHDRTRQWRLKSSK